MTQIKNPLTISGSGGDEIATTSYYDTLTTYGFYLSTSSVQLRAQSRAVPMSGDGEGGFFVILPVYAQSASFNYRIVHYTKAGDSLYYDLDTSAGQFFSKGHVACFNDCVIGIVATHIYGFNKTSFPQVLFNGSVLNLTWSSVSDDDSSLLLYSLTSGSAVVQLVNYNSQNNSISVGTALNLSSYISFCESAVYIGGGRWLVVGYTGSVKKWIIISSSGTTLTVVNSINTINLVSYGTDTLLPLGTNQVLDIGYSKRVLVTVDGANITEENVGDFPLAYLMTTTIDDVSNLANQVIKTDTGFEILTAKTANGSNLLLELDRSGNIKKKTAFWSAGYYVAMSPSAITKCGDGVYATCNAVLYSSQRLTFDKAVFELGGGS